MNSLYSTTCPACGGHKREERSLCYECFCALNSNRKAALYKRVGQGYEQALLSALNALRAEKFHEARPEVAP